MLDDALRVLGPKKIAKGTKQSIYKDGFFVGVGIFGGIMLNDLFRMSGLDINQKTLLGPTAPGNASFKETRIDEVYQYTLIGALVAASILTGKYVREVLPMAAGALTGITWSNYSERGDHPISILPF
jgi:hypothetical protein